MIILLDRQVLATVNAATGKGITSYVAVYADGALAATDQYVLATYGWTHSSLVTKQDSY